MFMIPEAVPEYFGAMSIGIDHIGPITSSAQKKPADRHSATMVMSWTNRIGNSESSAPVNPATVTLSRARRTLPVRSRILSDSTPPTLSPTTPAKNTPEANSAEFLMSRL
ncbi:hypothetical protein ACVMHR_001809 [Bradyrhizobium diazoefficiens]